MKQTTRSLVIFSTLILFFCSKSGGATHTHDHTNNKKNQNDVRGDEMIMPGAEEDGEEAMNNNNDSHSFSLGYQYVESGIQSRSAGNLAAAVSSFRNAVEAYKHHLVHHPGDSSAQEHLADTHYQLAETLSLMPNAGLDQSQPYYQYSLDLYAKLSTKSAKLRWAHCLARLGVLLMEQHSLRLPEMVEELLQQSAHGDWNDGEAMQEVMDGIDVNIPQQAVAYFQDAADVFRSNLDAEGSRQMLATSLQNMAVAMTHAGRVSDAIAALEEAIGIYEAMVHSGFEIDTAQGMAEAFYSLSDLYLQNSNYEMAKDRYRRSMDCYETFQLPPLQNVEDDVKLSNFDWSDQVAELEGELEEYMNIDADDMSMYGEEAEYFAGDGYNLKDPGYEGDLHTNLGSLYLAQGDTVLAASHLQQAIRKYELLGEANTHNMATAKYNLAMLYFKSSDFSKSAVLYAEAIDVFRSVGTEFSPIHVEDIEDQIQEVIQSQVKYIEDDTDGGNVNEGDRSRDKSKSSGVVSTDSYATIEKDVASGLIVDVEHFLLRNANFSSSDEL